MSAENHSSGRRGPWSPWATVGLTVLIALFFVIAESVVAVAYLFVKIAAGGSQIDAEAATTALETDGLFLSIAGMVAAPITIGATLFFAWGRRGPRVREYLGLRSAATGKTLRWLLYTVLLIALLDGAASLAGYAIVPEWVLAVYGSAVSLPLLAVALIVLAPAAEEVVFRGFLFEGLRRSRLGAAGTVVITALAWALMHVQYEWFYVSQVFFMGLLLGTARAHTGSVILPVLMHGLINTVSLLQASLEIQG